jgi:cell division protein ZapA (FtsZ GTPase activity inhibitor)
LTGNVRHSRLQPGTEKGVVSWYRGIYSGARFDGPARADKAGAKFRQEGGMSAQPVDIQIFGRSLRVNCPPEQQDALNMAADDLNQRLQDLKVRTRVSNTEQLVFIAALNVCHDGCCSRPLNKRCLNKVASLNVRMHNSNNLSC